MPSQPISVITSDEHRSHDPEWDVYSGTMVGRFEVPQRVDCIVQSLTDDEGFAIVAPASHGMQPILRVHNSDLVDFLSTAWKDYMTVLPDAQAVIAEMFIHPGLVEDMPVGRAPVDQRVRPSRLVLLRHVVAVERGLVAGCARLGRHRLVGCGSDPGRRADRLLAVPSSRTSRHTFGIRRVLPVEQRGDRRASADRFRSCAGHGARRRCPSRQRHAADLLPTRRRAVRQHPHGPRSELSVVRRSQPRARRGPGAGANLNLPIPLGTTGDRFQAELAVGIERSRRSIRSTSWCRWASIRLRRSDRRTVLEHRRFRRRRQAIAAIDRPMLIVQEGGYQLNRVGADVRAVLDGLRRWPRPRRRPHLNEGSVYTSASSSEAQNFAFAIHLAVGGRWA